MNSPDLCNLFCFPDSKGSRTNKNKKKNRRRKDLKSSSNDVNGDHNKVCAPIFLFLFRRVGSGTVGDVGMVECRSGSTVFLCFCPFLCLLSLPF